MQQPFSSQGTNSKFFHFAFLCKLVQLFSSKLSFHYSSKQLFKSRSHLYLKYFTLFLSVQFQALLTLSSIICNHLRKRRLSHECGICLKSVGNNLLNLHLVITESKVLGPSHPGTPKCETKHHPRPLSHTQLPSTHMQIYI